MRKTIYTFISLFLFLYPVILTAQTPITITGKVQEASVGIPAATVSLLAAKDSSWIKSALTDDGGNFSISEVQPGAYMISVTATGYKTTLQLQTITDNAQSVSISVQKEITSLNEVTVTGNKPFMEMSLGKITVNVDASPTNTGLNVLELLRKMPGITVDYNGNISMQGKQGALVLIDDRPTYLSGQELADYLKTIPADELAQVELITQPSAKYDAEGNAGIINIKRKKAHGEGWNGTATASFGGGVYPIYLGNALISYHKNKLSLSLSADEHKATGYAYWSEDQQLSDPQTGSITSISHSISQPKENFNIANTRLTADYSLTDKQTIGASVKVGYHTNSETDQMFISTTDFINNSTYYNNISYPDGFIRKDLSANAYYSCKFNSEHSLDINLDYLAYYNSPYQTINNTILDAQMNPEPNPLLLQSYQPSLISVYSAKADYTDTLQNGIKIEFGVKSSLVVTNNDARFQVYQDNDWIKDTTRSNHFIYKENINAAYVSAYKAFTTKWEARAGLRTENTNAQGIQQVHDQVFTNNYISLFPTANITYKPDKNNQFELDYGRRIDRPSYKSLNPFIDYSFQYSYTQGNPSLQPQFTNSIELKHGFKNMIITTLSVTNTTAVINDILVPNSATGIVYSTQANTGTLNAFNASVSFNKDIFKWLSVNAYATYFYAHYTGIVDNISMNTSGPGFFTGMTDQFILKKGWKAEAGIYYSGTYTSSIMATSLPSLYTTFAVSKKISNASTVKLSAADPFYTSVYKTNTDIPGLHTDAYFRYYSRNVFLAYTYTFGTSSAKQHQANAIDESGRIK